MTSLNQPRDELAKAKDHIRAMQNAGSLEDFEENWKDFLHKIERLWSKALDKYGKTKGWPVLKAKYEKIRRDDPLLSYLTKARGADEHTVDDIVSRQVAIEINASDGLAVNSPSDVLVEFSPAKTKLLPVSNRGRIYDVPRSHLGKPLDPTMVVDVAGKAATFYEEFLNTVESSLAK